MANLFIGDNKPKMKDFQKIETVGLYCAIVECVNIPLEFLIFLDFFFLLYDFNNFASFCHRYGDFWSCVGGQALED